ncbi:MAG: arsenate reductase ArsC [Fimbriimonadaceae bacterium]
MNVLFVCIENSNRSQMAEGFARHHGGTGVLAMSSGSRPSGRVNPKAIAAMAEKGIDISGHESNGLDQLPNLHWDWVVTMGCGDECPFIDADNRADWALQDPRDLEGEEFNAVRDDIERRVIKLLNMRFNR